jgi:hypothetical protein
MSSAFSITRAVNPPRAVYLDFPLGHTAGKANDRSLQRRIMIDTLSQFESIQVPGTIKALTYRWADNDDWKDSVMRPAKADATNNSDGNNKAHNDDRVERWPDPQYQTEEDESAAQETLAQGGCASCVWLESS